MTEIFSKASLRMRTEMQLKYTEETVKTRFQQSKIESMNVFHTDPVQLTLNFEALFTFMKLFEYCVHGI